ncbi:ORF6C domain-containing protein [Cohnella ginsengisoli]|uniref:ORF6C domain-containing protein n=1 Tax=Cohnella ginsengisoli TaxID=425004 RepID=A0A9X4QN40_9BACL|nr:ORF6C domain-containing protein [Cohnella ginsengisoli]MDG0791962.1 ORF6C domain-containing protein [Cohnella ginsengisoli]
MSKQLVTPAQELQILLEMSRNLIGKAEDHETRITKIEKTMTVDSRASLNIKQRAERHVTTILGGKDSPRYKEHYRGTIRKLWHAYWNNFGITTYRDTPAMLYDQALDFIDKWRPIAEAA